MITVESPTEIEFLEKILEYRLLLFLKDRHHELLSLVIPVYNERVIDFSEEYYKRFVNPRDEFGTVGYERYASDMEKAGRS